MNYSKLKGKIVEVYGSCSAFAKALGIDRSTLSGKMHNKNSWRANEIAKASELLGIPNDEIGVYFFSPLSYENETE